MFHFMVLQNLFLITYCHHPPQTASLCCWELPLKCDVVTEPVKRWLVLEIILYFCPDLIWFIVI